MTQAVQELDIEAAYHAVSDTYLGSEADIHALCREKRHSEPVMAGDFVDTYLKVPTNAGAKGGKCVVTLFRYKDILSVLRDAETFTSGFIAEGLGAFFDGLIILAMDGEQHRRTRALLQPVFMPETVKEWKPEIDRVIRHEFLAPMVAEKKANLMDFGLYFPIRVMYALMGFRQMMRKNSSSMRAGLWHWLQPIRSTLKKRRSMDPLRGRR